MPKVRDLGINVIPATMRPPEIGPGGVIACPDNTCLATNRCTPPTAQCEPHSEHEPRPPHCAETSHCAGQSNPPYVHYAGGFTPDAIVQLKQQLHDRIGKQLVN